MRILVSIMLFIGMMMGMSQGRPRHEIYSIVINNVIKNIEWSNESVGGEFVIAVYGDTEIFKTLTSWYGGKLKSRKTIVIRDVKSNLELKNASVVFIGKNAIKNFYDVIETVRINECLIITDSKDYIGKGSAIDLVTHSGKLSIYINKKTIEANGLKITDQLLKKADILIE